jgi:hypothetical protein
MDAPEIAPEVRGLIEEIVANPRSNLRLVPRRALLPWIESGGTASARQMSSDTATRHLVAAHREAVARMLREAAHIAFWKAPSLVHRPTGPDGTQYDPAREEAAWRLRAKIRVEATRHADDGIELLRRCLTSMEPNLGLDLARASMSLVPTEEASIALAEYTKSGQPRYSLRLYERVACTTRAPLLRGLGWGGSGSRLCYLGELEESMESYERAREGWPSAWFCLFNLASVAGNAAKAFEAALEIARLWPADSTQVTEAKTLFADWAKGLTPIGLSSAKRTIMGLRDRLPEAARRIGQVYA